DLTARPPRVLLRDDWLAVSRLGRWQRVDTGRLAGLSANPRVAGCVVLTDEHGNQAEIEDRKSTRLNSSHEWISYAVFGLKKKQAEASARGKGPRGCAEHRRTDRC